LSLLWVSKERSSRMKGKLIPKVTKEWEKASSVDQEIIQQKLPGTYRMRRSWGEPTVGKLRQSSCLGSALEGNTEWSCLLKLVVA
jgi:hypothetical protein